MISRHNYIGQVDIKILQVMAKLRHNTHETYRTVCMSLQQIQFKCKDLHFFNSWNRITRQFEIYKHELARALRIHTSSPQINSPYIRINHIDKSHNNALLIKV